MNQSSAIVIGASGATGKQLVFKLLENKNIYSVKIFVRKEMAIVHPKLQTFVVDFDAIATWDHLVTGDVLFCTMGTTLKQAGSKAAQYKVDVTYQYEVAKAAANNGVATFVLLSAYGAKSSSLVFYSKMKGELEEMIMKLHFYSIHIFQPGILERFADDGRLLENLTVKMIKWLNGIGVLRSQAPMPVEVLASKMINVALSDNSEKLSYYRLNDIFKL